ncbi:hypothetical protein B0H16DRAFT_1740664 [Mycena metata]|uniref:Uncharacterized protein n=1 Tax=Mycena metata TaxID=1033252 RepID=A0AAD7MH77_9AGAR|nr:hypothetical protein B0H16DRAFT_1740664 [Mycena metata]
MILTTFPPLSRPSAPTPLSCSPLPAPRAPAASSRRLSIPANYNALLTTFLPSSSFPYTFLPVSLISIPGRRGTTNRVLYSLPAALGNRARGRLVLIALPSRPDETPPCCSRNIVTTNNTIVCMQLWDR